ncbi:endo-beta-N-acetylglucosaminidase [Helcococcus sueciensis]
MIFKSDSKKKFLKKALAFVLGATIALNPMTYVFAQENATENTSSIDPVVQKKASLKPRGLRLNLDSIPEWDPANLPNDELNRGSVPLKERVKGSPINEYASSEGEILSLAYLLGNNYSKYSSVGDYEFNVNTFDMWQYVGTQVFWDGAVPTPDVIDAAHKNGVPILGTLFFNWSGSASDNEIFAKFLQKDSDGKYPAARKLAEIAKHYGFDGYFFNQETTGYATGGKSQELKDFILEMKAHGESIGQPLIISFYDAMANNGYRAHYDSINSANDIWMKKTEDGRIAVDQFFANFNWYTNKINSSKEHMESIDRSPFDFYAGFELQKDITYTKKGNRPALLGDDNKLKVSIGLFIPDTINGEAKTEEGLHDAINKFWTGENRNPATINDAPNVYNGMARYVVDTTPILEPNFYTSFNTGHGRHWFKDGNKVVTQDWNSRSVQDVLPTWTWWTNTDKGQPLNAYYDFEDAYNGGSSVKLYGKIDEWSYHEVNLFATKFKPQNDTFLDITYKGGQGASLNLTVNLDENYAPSAVRELRLIPSEEDKWETVRLDLSQFAGETIYSIGLKIENTAGNKDYKLNLGELVIGNSDAKLNAPQNFKVDEQAVHTGTEAEAIVSFDKVEGAYRYDVYKETENGEEWLFSSSNNNIYLPKLSRSIDSNETVQKLKVYAVAENGKYSEAATTEFDCGFAASDTTLAKDKYRNITPEAKLISTDNESKAKIINDTLVDLTDKWWNPGPDNTIIEFEEPRTVKRWVIEHAGHAGESYNDGAMNAANYSLDYWDEDSQSWKTAEDVVGNIYHVDDRILPEPVTAKRWRLNVTKVDNGTPWGGLRIYNWKMYEELDTESDNIPMTSAEIVHQKDDLYAIKFNKEKLSRFYRQKMSDFTIRVYRDAEATDLIAEKVFDENGYAVFTDVKLEGDKGSVFYRTQEEGKEESNILALSYVNSDNSVEEPEDEVLPNPFGDEKAKIVSLDAGRKYFSVKDIKQIIDSLQKNDYNYLHLLFGNDGFRFLLDDMTVNTKDASYKSDDVKEGILKGNGIYAASKNLTIDADKALTEAEMDEIIEYANSKGITIIPGLNSPGHMDAILEAMVHLGFERPHYYNGAKKSVTTMDLQKPEVAEFTTEFIQLYINYFSNKGMKVFNFGADEYANDAFGNPGWANLVQNGQYDLFVDYANELSERIVKAKMRPLAFNDGFYYRGAEDKEFNKQLIIAYWTAGWWGFNVAPTTTFVEKGHDILNVNDSWYYVLGRENSGGYNRQSALNNMKSGTKGFDVNVGTKVDTIGSMIAFWADDPSETYEFEKLNEWIKVFAENNPKHFNIKEYEVNKEQLAFAIETVEAALEEVEEKMTEDSIANLKAKLKEAKDAYNDESIKQAQVDEALLNLKEAFENLVEKEPEQSKVNKEELQKTLELIPSLMEDIKDKFTEESVKSLESEIEKSNKVLEKEDATQEEVNEAVTKLKEAYKNLELKEEKEEIDTSVIEALIDKLNKSLEENSDKFTDESKENLENAIKSSTELLKSEDLTQEKVDDEILKLVDAFASVKLKEEEKPVVDTTALSSLVEKANTRLEEDLEDESRKNLENAIEKAKEIIAKEDLTQEEVNEAFSELVDALINSKVKVQEPEEPKDPEEPEQPEEPKLHDTKGFITGTTNVRTSPNGPVIGTLEREAIVEGEYEEGSNWVKLDYYGQEAYVYKPLISDTIEVKGFASGDSNIRKSPNGEVTGLAKREEIVEGVVSIDNPNWIKTDKGYIYRPLVVDTIKVRGLMSGTTNVRMTPNGTIIGTLGKAEYVEGTLNITNPNWVRIRYQNRDGYVYRSLIVDSVSVSGTVTATVNVRQTPNGKVLGTHRKGVKLTGKLSASNPNWVEIQYKGQRAYVYKEFVK